MVHTRRRGQLFDLSTTQLVSLQARRDMIAARIDKRWTKKQKSMPTSRGFNNPGWRCYSNAVLQAFMHMPQFTNWIMKHRVSHNCGNGHRCIGCNMKGLAEEYWNHPRNAQGNPLPLAANNRWLSRVNASAVASNTTQFMHGRYEDSDEFYQWILRELDGLNPGNTHQEQYRALYVMSFQNQYTCSLCNTTRAMPPDEEHGLNLQLPATINDVPAAIAAFLNDTIDVDCNSCGGTTRGQRVKTIEAGPTILRLSLRIFTYNQNGITKITRPITVPQQLNLTNNQTNTSKPLTYTISSVVQHAGTGRMGKDGMTADGHYRATAKGPNNVYVLNDSIVHQLQAPAQITANPADTTFTAYILTYVRDAAAVPKMCKELI